MTPGRRVGMMLNVRYKLKILNCKNAVRAGVQRLPYE